MKRLLLTTATASALMLGGCIIVVDDGKAYASAHDGNRVMGGDVSLDLAEDGDFQVTAADVELSGRVGATLTVASSDFYGRDLEAGALRANAADLRFEGNVADAVTLNAADVNWSGAIGGQAEINAADLVFNGDVAGPFRANLADGRLSGTFTSVRLNAADIHFDDDAQIAGDVYANVADFEFGGTLTGALDLAARYVVISGQVDGPVAIWADEGRRANRRRDGLVQISGAIAGGEICATRVELSGAITGPLSVMADEAPQLSGAAQGADIRFTPRNGERCERPS